MELSDKAESPAQGGGNGTSNPMSNFSRIQRSVTCDDNSSGKRGKFRVLSFQRLPIVSLVC